MLGPQYKRRIVLNFKKKYEELKNKQEETGRNQEELKKKQKETEQNYEELKKLHNTQEKRKNEVEEMLGSFLTINQIDIMLKRKSKVWWTSDESIYITIFQ